MFSNFLNFEWKQFFRSSYWQKSLVLNIILIIFGIYMLMSFLILGIALYPMLKETYPDQNPLFQINTFLFFWIIVDIMLRFFMQKLPSLSVKPFLTLPIPKNKIIHYVLGKSMLSFFNFLPLFAVIPFSIVALIKGDNSIQAVTWAFLMIIITLIVNFLKDKIGEHHSFFVNDPNGYTVEFKCFTNSNEVFKSENSILT